MIFVNFDIDKRTFVTSSIALSKTHYTDFSLLIGSMNGLERDFTIELEQFSLKQH